MRNGLTDDRDALTCVVLQVFAHKLPFALVLCCDPELSAFIGMSIRKLTLLAKGIYRAEVYLQSRFMVW